MGNSWLTKVFGEESEYWCIFLVWKNEFQKSLQNSLFLVWDRVLYLLGMEGLSWTCSLILQKHTNHVLFFSFQCCFRTRMADRFSRSSPYGCVPAETYAGKKVQFLVFQIKYYRLKFITPCCEELHKGFVCIGLVFAWFKAWMNRKISSSALSIFESETTLKNWKMRRMMMHELRKKLLWTNHWSYRRFYSTEGKAKITKVEAYLNPDKLLV